MMWPALAISASNSIPSLPRGSEVASPADWLNGAPQELETFVLVIVNFPVQKKKQVFSKT